MSTAFRQGKFKLSGVKGPLQSPAHALPIDRFAKLKT